MDAVEVTTHDRPDGSEYSRRDFSLSKNLIINNFLTIVRKLFMMLDSQRRVNNGDVAKPLLGVERHGF